jgi:DNA-binding NarL/FixJ family response regulator
MRILIADSQPTVRYALSILLKGQPGWQIVGFARNAGELLVRVGTFKPDVLLLDWDLPGLNHRKLVCDIHLLAIKLVVISTRPEIQREANLLGIDSFVSKVDPPNKLLEILYSFEQQKDL